MSAPEFWDLGGIVADLRKAREHWRDARQPAHLVRELPSREAVGRIMQLLRDALFPPRLSTANLRRAGEDFFVGHALDTALNLLLAQTDLELRCRQREPDTAISTELISREAGNITQRFAQRLPGVRVLLDTDVAAALDADPAARSVEEVLICYPGLIALTHHRIAHELYGLGVPLIARMLAEAAHAQTGIDIHPGAQIGSHCFIDHGTGLVIGETAELGERVHLHQSVTLGAARPAASDADLRQRPRHPIIEDEVVIHAGATILGRVTIGRRSVIGGNVWLTHDVPAGSHLTPARHHLEIRQAS